jgi:hypothetical protein
MNTRNYGTISSAAASNCAEQFKGLNINKSQKSKTVPLHAIAVGGGGCIAPTHS